MHPQLKLIIELYLVICYKKLRWFLDHIKKELRYFDDLMFIRPNVIL